MASSPRQPQARWLAAAARREAARAAFFDRPAEVVQQDFGRLDRLLMVEARWRFAKTMANNPHSYTLRRQWLWPGGDDDFVFCVETIRTIGDREKYPPGPGGRLYECLNRDGKKFWAMGFFGSGGPINYSDGRHQIFLINRKPVLPGDE